MDVTFQRAEDSDASAVARLEQRVADRLTERFGRGQWSICASEKSVRRRIRDAHVVVARIGEVIVATLTLSTRKPWAIEPAYFTPVRNPLYLVNMAVTPGRQRQGIGRSLLQEAHRVAVSWPAQAIRLDAYDAPAGAGSFYARCGYREMGRTTYRHTPLIYYEMMLVPHASVEPSGSRPFEGRPH